MAQTRLMYREDNPLLIEHIFEHILEFLLEEEIVKNGMTKQVQIIRRVCKMWNTVSTNWFLKRRDQIEMGLYNSCCAIQQKDKKIQDYISVFKGKFMTIPFNNFLLGSNAMYYRLLVGFLHINTNIIVNLELHFNSDLQIKFRKDWISNKLNMPNLQMLKINLHNFRKEFAISPNFYNFHYCLNSLLTAATNLKDFSFRVTSQLPDVYSPFIPDMMQAIATNLPQSVDILCLDASLNDDLPLLHLLHKRKIKELEIRYDFVRPAYIFTLFILVQRKHLQKLKLIGKREFGTVLFDIPRLKKLKHLEFDGTLNVYVDITKSTPFLQRLNVNKWQNKQQLINIMNMNSGMNESITTIDLTGQFKVKNVIAKLTNFTKLMSLTLGPSEDVKEAMVEVFALLNNLEQLSITMKDDIDNEYSGDSWLSGVSAQRCEQVLLGRDFQRESIRFMPKIYNASLLNMRRLKKFAILDRTCSLKMTSFTAYFVFLHMENLSELSISKSWISTFFINILKEKMTVNLANDDYLSARMDPLDPWGIPEFDENEDLQSYHEIGISMNNFLAL